MVDVDEDALEFLGETAFAEAAFLGFEEVGGDADAVRGPGADFDPTFADGGGPLGVEEGECS